MSRAIFVAFAAFCLLSPLRAADPDRDFSGTWLLDRQASNSRELPAPVDSLIVTQNDLTLECSAGPAQWILALDGNDSKYAVAAETWNSRTKWEGSALLVNTLVTG